MKKSYVVIITVVAVVAIIVFWMIGAYNKLVVAEESVSTAWANVESQYQRRADLIPNLVSTVKGYAAHEQDTEANLLTAIQAKLEVSVKVAKRLLEEYRTAFQIESLGERVFDISFGGDPARAYDHFMRRTLLLQRMEEVLKPRELNLVRCYLGIGQPNEQSMTFQELAIRLNYNGPSGEDVW